MSPLWFVVPVHGRENLTAICLRQLRRTCDALAVRSIRAHAVIVGCDDNLDVARELGFATVTRGNDYLSAKFNDGIQAACDPDLRTPADDRTWYRVLRPTGYRGHTPGTVFIGSLERAAAEKRAIDRGDIAVVARQPLEFFKSSFHPPADWDGRPADYVVPCGSDDWVDWRIFLNLPPQNTMQAYRLGAFVDETGRSLLETRIGYQGGFGIRVWPRRLMSLLKFRPADEDRERGCDTSILVNVTRAWQRAFHDEIMRVTYRDVHPHQIVDWKTSGEQVTTFETVRSRHGGRVSDPFETLAGVYPADALEEMQAHYRLARDRVAA